MATSSRLDEIQSVDGAAVALRLRGITKAFGAYLAIDDISFDLPGGTVAALVGENGAGKSTLLSMIAGELRPDRGVISITGSGENRPRYWRKRLIGFAGQRPGLYSDLTVEENLLLFASALGVLQPKLQVDAVVERCLLSRQRRKRVRECSQGIIKKAAIARAILHCPKILVLDEPFANLDQSGEELICGILDEQRLTGGLAIFAAHEERWINHCGTMTICLSDGHLKQLVDRRAATSGAGQLQAS